MAETEYRRLLQAAQDKALFGYLAVVQRAMQDADRNVAELMVTAKSSNRHAALTGIRHFLRQDGNAFLRALETSYRSQLERAMQTMYRDLRAELRKVSLDELSLIDDEVVSQQIEVGRLVQRMRDANEESLGRLNVIIARMHGQVEARERENPFRPYLLSRALYDAVRQTMPEETKARLLFEHLSDALIPHLTGFYGALREVFESSGVHGTFVAQRSRAAHNQRYFGAPAMPGGAAPGADTASSRIAPGLERLIAALGQLNAAQGASLATGSGGAAPSLQEFIRGMVSPARRQTLLPPQAEQDVSPLLRRIGALQKQMAQEVPGAVAAAPVRLATLRERFGLEQASVAERMTVEVVTMLFDIILDDEQIPTPLRSEIARLQIPVLKAALLDSSLLHDESHPARRLLNRMSSTALGADPGSDAGRALGAEIERAARQVLTHFETDSQAFVDALADFEAFLQDQLRGDDDGTAHAIEAVEAAERYSVLLTNIGRALCDALLPLNLDKIVSDFIIAVWPHVLVRAAWLDRLDGGNLLGQYVAVLPELVWSVQDKPDAQERTALIRLLPGLVRRLRSGFELIQLPEEDSRPLLDHLVARHTGVLRAGASGKRGPDLDALRQAFAGVAVNWERASWGLSEPPQVREEVVEEALTRIGATADLRLAAGAPAAAADREFLAQTYLLGTRVSVREEATPRPAQLVWVSTHRSLYLFRREDARLLLYSASALLEALNGQTVAPLEYAPVFERAVESLLFGAEKLDA